MKKTHPGEIISKAHLWKWQESREQLIDTPRKWKRPYWIGIVHFD